MESKFHSKAYLLNCLICICINSSAFEFTSPACLLEQLRNIIGAEGATFFHLMFSTEEKVAPAMDEPQDGSLKYLMERVLSFYLPISYLLRILTNYNNVFTS